MDYGADDMPITLKAKLLLRYDLLRYDLHKVPERVLIWLAWKLPKSLVYWCAIRLIAHATTNEYGNTVVPEVTAMDALERWKL
jgi:hypothetical protein